MDRQQIPETFDWVEARHACSAKGEFIALRLDVERDVAHRNELLGSRHPVKLIPSGDERFVVFVDTGNDPFAKRLHTISVTLIEGKIEIVKMLPTGNEEMLLELKPSLDDRGKCMLKDGGRHLYRWQVLKEVLEDLFF